MGTLVINGFFELYYDPPHSLGEIVGGNDAASQEKRRVLGNLNPKNDKEQLSIYDSPVISTDKEVFERLSAFMK